MRKAPKCLTLSMEGPFEHNALPARYHWPLEATHGQYEIASDEYISNYLEVPALDQLVHHGNKLVVWL